MTTKKTTRSSSSSSTLIKQSLKAPSAKHKPPVSSPLAVTSLIKGAITSSEIKKKDNHMPDIQDAPDTVQFVQPHLAPSTPTNTDPLSSFPPNWNRQKLSLIKRKLILQQQTIDTKSYCAQPHPRG
ncbi:hypothetical protein BDB01DRAFT_840320 [Pilobolus umbonatus]|nr:hypothetical protein BDB01DRAFT_840320 [Pilobolus umbonatus]